MFVVIAVILVIKKQYPGANEDFGRLGTSALALGAAGAGAFLAAVTAPWISRGLRLLKPGLICLGFLISGLGIVVLGGVSGLPAIMGLTFSGGYGAFLSKVAVDAQVQEALEDRYRGRAFALYDILYNVASVIAGLAMVAFQSVPMRPLLAGAGVGTVAVSLVLARRMKQFGMELRRMTPAER
jgi:hypothetical protein